MLEVRQLDAGYGRVRVIRNLSLAVAHGSITAVLGANGAGKTTLMRAISGLVQPDAGEIRLDGGRIEALPTEQRVARGISLIPEGRLIFPDLSVEQNLRIGAATPRARPGAAARLDSIFAMFPRLAERRRQAGATLSGGEQQMLAIGRGLMADPKLILLDEPSLGLAPKIVTEMFDTIGRIRASGVTVVLVEQNLRRALAIADEAYVIEHGHVAMSGAAATLAANPEIRRAYLGI
ncbi:MAG: ABC transporter ATP-binding protein [Lautropia sp.]